MSLHSGKPYRRDYERQSEAEPEPPTDAQQQGAAATDQQSPTDRLTPEKRQPSPTRSIRSNAPSRCSHSTSAIKAYAKAQAAKAQLAFAQREAEMMRQKVELV